MFLFVSKIISVLGNASSCSDIFSHVDTQQMHMHLSAIFSAHIGDLSQKPTLWKCFHNIFLLQSAQQLFFAKATSITMRTALTGVRRADRATAVLSARPLPGYKGD
jgi:hypothetical protein